MAAPLRITARELERLLAELGPSLALWRAAEIAVLRTQSFPAPVLDLGCGDGIVTSHLLRRVAIGVDPCRDALRRAAARRLYQRLEARAIEHAPIDPGSIATVVSNSVLEHVPNLDPVLRAVARALRPGGQLVFTVPTEAFSAWLALPFSAYGNWRNRHYGHRNLWPLERWAHELRQTGLTIVAVRPYMPRVLVTAWDVTELAQRIWIGRRRAFGLLWRRLPTRLLTRLAHRLSRLDLAAPPPGGGRLIVAQK